MAINLGQVAGVIANPFVAAQGALARTKVGSSALDSVGRGIFGDSRNAGALGVGQFKASPYNIDMSAFNDDSQGQQFRSDVTGFANAAAGRAAPTMQAATIDPAQQAQFRAKQMALAQALEAQAAGRGPSLAQDQLRMATDRNIAQQMAMAASGGGNAALARRQLGNQAAAMNQEAAAQSSIIRAQEQMAARQALAQALESARTQDIGLASKQAELLQGANTNNLEAAIRQRQLNDQAALEYRKLFADSLSNTFARRAAGQELGVKNALGVMGVNQAGYKTASEARGNFLGKLGEGLASYAGAGAGA